LHCETRHKAGLKNDEFSRLPSSSGTVLPAIYRVMLLALAIVFLAIWLGAVGSGYKLPFLIHAPLVIAFGLALGHFLLPRRRDLHCDDNPEHQRRGSSLLRRR
jgi:fatty acid desaturase